MSADGKPLAGYIDLHTHSIYSDGSMRPAEVVALARELGLAAIALTDHDTVAGLPEALAAGEKYSVEVVPGLEFSTRATAQVHILGYYFDPSSPALAAAFAELQEERRETHARYLSLLAENGFPMSDEEVRRVAPVGGIGRAHYARVMMDKGYVGSVKEAFDRYLGVGMPCYIERRVMHPARAIALIHEAGGVAFFAHPHQTKLPRESLIALLDELTEAGLDGIEGYYTEYTPRMSRDFRALAAERGLAVCGGSDFHAAMKPHISLGSGTENLRVPYEVLANIKALVRARRGAGE